MRCGGVAGGLPACEHTERRATCNLVEALPGDKSEAAAAKALEEERKRIQTRTEQRESKVPLLGDMPFAGYIFRSKRFTDVRTELRVLLTPRVIPGEPSDAVRIFSEITGEEIRKITPSEEFNELLPEQYRQKIVDEIKPPESKP